MENEILQELKKYIPEIEDYDIEIIKQFYTVAEQKHSTQEEKLLKIYFLGYLLTATDNVGVSKITISNVTLEETENESNVYLNIYKNLLNALGLDIAEVSII